MSLCYKKAWIQQVLKLLMGGKKTQTKPLNPITTPNHQTHLYGYRIFKSQNILTEITYWVDHKNVLTGGTEVLYSPLTTVCRIAERWRYVALFLFHAVDIYKSN